jgi:hypothetical protein
MRRLSIFLISLIFVLTTFAESDRGIGVSGKLNRIALVIGNSNYQSAPLKNPANDANDMALVLKQKGFTVTKLTNATQRQMEKEIGRFGKSLRDGGVGLFFYAGHGMQVNGTNYLIPIGANIEAEEDIKYESVDANRILAKMEAAGNDLNMVFLDACRNNPFARSFRSSNKGLAQMDAPKGSFVSFATAPGSVAADGAGRNGLFTGQLIKHMQTPELPLTRMMMEVRKGVLRESEDKQTPWDVSSLTGEFYFSVSDGSVVGKTPMPKLSTIDEEDAIWKIIEKSEYAEDFQDYLGTYPNGRFATAARIKIRQLKREQKDSRETIRQKPTNVGAKSTSDVKSEKIRKRLYTLNHSEKIDYSESQLFIGGGKESCFLIIEDKTRHEKNLIFCDGERSKPFDNIYFIHMSNDSKKWAALAVKNRLYYLIFNDKTVFGPYKGAYDVKFTLESRYFIARKETKKSYFITGNMGELGPFDRIRAYYSKDGSVGALTVIENGQYYVIIHNIRNYQKLGPFEQVIDFKFLSNDKWFFLIKKGYKRITVFNDGNEVENVILASLQPAQKSTPETLQYMNLVGNEIFLNSNKSGKVSTEKIYEIRHNEIIDYTESGLISSVSSPFWYLAVKRRAREYYYIIDGVEYGPTQYLSKGSFVKGTRSEGHQWRLSLINNKERYIKFDNGRILGPVKGFLSDPKKDKWCYLKQRNDGNYIIFNDNRELGPFKNNGLYGSTLYNGIEILKVDRNGNEKYLLFYGKEFGPFDRIYQTLYSSRDSFQRTGKTAFKVRQNKSWFLLFNDGKKFGAFSKIGNVAYSEISDGWLAYIEKDGVRYILFHNGRLDRNAFSAKFKKYGSNEYLYWMTLENESIFLNGKPMQ